MRNKLFLDNPIWLIVGSLLLFSFISLLLLFRGHSQNLQKQSSHIVLSPTASPTPTLQSSIAIPYLQNKHYNATLMTVDRTVGTNALYTSQVISFSVDGLKEYALLDTPTSTPPLDGFPVIVLDHGYINPQLYDTVNSYAGPTNYFASRGFIVIKPDYRGNGSSDGSDDPLKRFDYPTDVMTVIASLKNIPHANTKQVYLWGHSMGGEVTLEVLEILGKQPELGKDVKAVVLWAPVTDPAEWFGPDNIKKIPEAMLTPFPYTQMFALLGQPTDTSSIWQSINPLNFLSAISIPMQLNHGTADSEVPYTSSQDLAMKMKQAGKQVDFISYSGADHNLSPSTFQALQNNVQFFKSH